jgi:hypothetical protein
MARDPDSTAPCGGGDEEYLAAKQFKILLELTGARVPQLHDTGMTRVAARVLHAPSQTRSFVGMFPLLSEREARRTHGDRVVLRCV